MSMFNDIAWDAQGNDDLYVNNSEPIKEYAERFPRGHWSFLGLGSEKWYGTHDGKPDGSLNRTAEKMLQNFKDSGHPIFRGTSALERGKLRSKVSGKKSIHFNGSTQNMELLLPMVVSVNQLRLYGAVADMIAELPVDQRAPAAVVTRRHRRRGCPNTMEKRAARALKLIQVGELSAGRHALEGADLADGNTATLKELRQRPANPRDPSGWPHVQFGGEGVLPQRSFRSQGSTRRSFRHD